MSDVHNRDDQFQNKENILRDLANGGEENKSNPQDPNIEVEGKIDLGRVETNAERKENRNKEFASFASDNMGYRKTPTIGLPSKGMFYPPDIDISKRPLDVEEIKHYSTMDEDDFIDIDDKVNYVLKKGLKIYSGGKEISHKYLKEADKLFLLFDIRDITFDDRENILYQTVQSPCHGKKEKVEIENSVFGYYEIKKAIMHYYSEEERCFIITHKSDKPKFQPFRLYVPSIGVLQFISRYIRDKEIEKQRQKGGFYDKQFLTFLQFMVKDWVDLTNDTIDKYYKDYKSWGPDKHSVVCLWVEKMDLSIKPTIERRCKEEGCDKPFSTQIRFRDGYKSIFYIQDTIREVFPDLEED